MPFVNIKITKEGVTKVQKQLLVEGVTELLSSVLKKNQQPLMSLLTRWKRTIGVLQANWLLNDANEALRK